MLTLKPPAMIAKPVSKGLTAKRISKPDAVAVDEDAEQQKEGDLMKSSFSARQMGRELRLIMLRYSSMKKRQPSRF